MSTINSKICKLQEGNNNTLAGLYYKDFVNAVGVPNEYDNRGYYHIGNPNDYHSIRTGLVAQWGSIHDEYYIKIAFDPCTEEFITIEKEYWDYRWTDCNTNNNKSNQSNQTNDDMSVGGTFTAILLITAVIFGIGLLCCSL